MNYFLVRFCKIYGASFRSMIERIALCRDYASLRSVSVGNGPRSRRLDRWRLQSKI
ncbi:hypothetical protein [Leptospira interrogans]|uniref:hypothetical protein n=1 Tax=Leptospira interrogans TaxID=173 RepID=UPI0003193DB4|nr:hypothetical protein [Leptospira interrogans]MBE8385774.1 hypothetical protein [Leptospira interrogans serovar Pomona]MBE8418769.1 hypothetical protein [Leptospira interrogans serovar Pomona]